MCGTERTVRSLGAETAVNGRSGSFYSGISERGVLGEKYLDRTEKSLEQGKRKFCMRLRRKKASIPVSGMDVFI